MREPTSPDSKHHLRITIIIVILGWTFFYNMMIKGLTPVASFFKILDTISDEFIMGSIFIILFGCAIVVAFSFTKLYSQIIANIYSFRILEILYYRHLKKGNIRIFISNLIRLQEQPRPPDPCPTKIASLLFAFAFLYVVSWLYLALFSEALFFVAWSAGVNPEINDNNLLLLPILALAIPFSARVMAYLNYPYAQDYADFIPGAVFVMLIVVLIGYLFQSDDQIFFLPQIANNPDYLSAFLLNGILLAFIPVFFEAMFWLVRFETSTSQEHETPDQKSDEL